MPGCWFSVTRIGVFHPNREILILHDIFVELQAKTNERNIRGKRQFSVKNN